MQKYQNNIAARNGDAVVGIKVLIKLAGTATPATIYSDDGVNVTPNPLTTNANGYFEFYVANGLYDIAVSGVNTYTDVLIADALGIDADALKKTEAAATDGATKVGTPEGTVQDALDGRPTATTLALPSAAAELGAQSADAGSVPMSVQDALDLATVDLLSKIPKSEWATIASRTSAYDCTAALVAAVATGKRVTVSMPGRYKLTTAYAGTTDFDVEALCEGVEFDLSGIASGTCIGNSGSLTRIADVNGGFTINQGRNLVTLASAPAVASGDWICIYNPTDYSYSGWRNYYRAGEWKQVLSVSGNNITTTEPFYASYAAADVQVYRMNSVRCRLANVRLLGGSGNKQLVIFSQVDGAIFDRVTSEGANYSGYGFDRCVRGVVYDPQVRNIGAGFDDYGIVAGNSQHIKTHRGSIYGRRHAVAQGGLDAVCSVPCRDIRTYDAILRNDPEQNVGAADFHGNVEESSFERCTIYGGVKFGGGDNNFCVDCTVYAPGGEVQANAIGWVAYWAEVKGGRSGFRNSRLFTTRDPQPSNQGILSINGTGASGVDSRTVLPFIPMVKDCSLYARGMSSATRILLFINRGATVEFNPEIDGLRLDVDALSSILYTSQASGTAASSGIIVDRIFGAPTGALLHNAGGTTYRDFKHRLQKQDGVWQGTSVVNTVVSASPITFPLAYPRNPRASLALSGAGGASFAGQIGAQTPQMSLLTLTNAAIRPQIRTAANMTAGDVFDVSWSVDLREC